MKNKYTAAANRRFIKAMRDVIRNGKATDGKVQSVRDFAQSMGHTSQDFNRFINGGGHVHAGIIEAACRKYNINPTWIFLGEEQMYRTQKPKPDSIEARLDRIEQLLNKRK